MGSKLKTDRAFVCIVSNEYKIGSEVMNCELNKDKGGGGVKGKRFQDSFK